MKCRKQISYIITTQAKKKLDGHCISPPGNPTEGFQVVIRSVRRLSHILLTCPAQVHFRLLICSITSLTIVFSLTQTFIFLSRYVMIIFVCMAAILFGCECPGFRAVCHCWKYARVVDLSLQAYPNVTLEDVAVLDECCPPDRDSSRFGFCLWCCISVSGRCSFQRSRPESC